MGLYPGRKHDYSREGEDAQEYTRDASLEGLAQDLQDAVSELRAFIQEEDAVVHPRHFARQRHVAPTDQPHSRDRVMRGATRAGRDQRRAGAREARDAVEARGLDGCGQAHRRRMVGSRRASLEVPTPGGPSRSRL